MTPRLTLLVAVALLAAALVGWVGMIDHPTADDGPMLPWTISDAEYDEWERQELRTLSHPRTPDRRVP